MKVTDPLIEKIHNDTERFLLDNSTYFSTRDEHGNPPLHAKIQEGNFEIVRYLVSRGRDLGEDGIVGYKKSRAIDLNVKNTQGETALDFAKKLSLTNTKLHSKMNRIIDMLEKAKSISKKKRLTWIDNKTDNKTGLKHKLSEIHVISSRHDPAFMWLAFAEPHNREQTKMIQREDIGAKKFLDAYRKDDLKSMERALLKYDLRLEDTGTTRELRFSASMSSELNHYAALGGNTRMDIALAKTQDDYNPDLDTEALADEFFMAGYTAEDYDLMSDIITEYDLDNLILEEAGELAYSAIEKGYYEMSKALIKQCKISTEYIPQDKNATLGQKLTDFENNHPSLLTDSSPSEQGTHDLKHKNSRLYVDLIGGESTKRGINNSRKKLRLYVDLIDEERTTNEEKTSHEQS